MIYIYRCYTYCPMLKVRATFRSEPEVLPNCCTAPYWPFVLWHVDPLLGNGYIFYGSASNLYKWYRAEWNKNANEKENRANLWQSLIVSCWNCLWLRQIVKEGFNKSNHPIQNTLLLLTSHKQATIWVLVLMNMNVLWHVNPLLGNARNICYQQYWSSVFFVSAVTSHNSG